MTPTDVAVGRISVSHRKVRLVLLLLPIWILGAGEIVQFASKSNLDGPLERSGLIKGRDFVQFYVAGTLVRESRWRDLYDVAALQQAAASVVPAADRIIPAPVYPPVVALFFTPWARLSYLDARWLWFVVSAIAYLAGVSVVIHGVDQLRGYRTLAWVTATLSPALAIVLTSGQLSAAALCFWALAAVAYERGRLLLCGVCLGLLAYKPPLLFGVILALVVARGWSILTGIVLCGAAQIVFAVVFLGLAPWMMYVRSLLALPQYYYLTDTLPRQKQSLLGFFQLLLGTGPMSVLLAILVGSGVLALWRRHEPATRSRWFVPMLATSSVLLSPHFYVYDLVVMTPALLLVAGSLSSATGTFTERVLGWCAYALLYAPYSGALTTHLRLQLSTIALLGLLAAVHRLWRFDAASATL